MEVKSLNKNIQFLAGGGEMGKLTREKAWGKTYLGPPHTWPQSLRTTLSIILNSKFPMFLFWGNELTCFYNDAYRPSLGREGKHPSILGMRGEDAWPEIWDIIKPLIDRVLAGGEATWSEDQLIPIFRNGKIEDVYWTFSYSPVNDESGKPAGVFVTCTESTEKINLLKQLENSNEELAFAIEATELGTWDYNPLTNKFSGNKRLKKWFGLMSHTEIELHHAINTIAAEDRDRVSAAIQKALDNSSGGNYDIEYTIIDPVSKKERIVHAKGRAWFDETNRPSRFNGTLEDVTEQTIARRKFENLFKEIEQHREKLNIVVNASELATWEMNLKTREIHYSDKYLEIMGYENGTALTHPQILKHLHPDDLPVREKAFEDAFSNGILSYETRIIWKDGSMHWTEVRGKVFYDEDGGPSHLIGTVRDITNEKDLTNKMEKLVEERTKELILSNESLKKSEQRYHLMVEEVQDYAILYLNREGIVENWNTGAEKIKGYKADEIIGKNFSNFYTKEDRESNLPQTLLNLAVQTGRAGQEGWRVRKDGSYFWASIVITAVHDEKG
ncbi:MAG TPA: PAS domain-containing protein, partial [Ferruginibacter sp.]|nr:PAS domain-containing protein [Ferruginibacter sp.]